MRVTGVVPANYRYWINIAVGKGKALNLEKVVEAQRRSPSRDGSPPTLEVQPLRRNGVAAPYFGFGWLNGNRSALFHPPTHPQKQYFTLILLVFLTYREM